MLLIDLLESNFDLKYTWVRD